MPQIVRRTMYEWDIETVDEYGDIIDHHHSDACPGTQTSPDKHLVLVRDCGTGWSDDPDHFEMDDRQWAYVTDGKLPGRFDGGAVVPQRLHRELLATQK